jgi:SAM-dependent methyltransferase
VGIVGGTFGYWLLRLISPRGEGARLNGSAYESGVKLNHLLGPHVWKEVEGKTVISFGCGQGADLIECARRGARKAIGVDIREGVLEKACQAARQAGVSDRCQFTTKAEEKADLIISINAFEHFDNPAEILRVMRSLLKEDGYVITAFGPTWYHPLGGHLFSVFPWAHLIFTEKALLRWRADFKADGATRFAEVGGGLNQMTISRFEQIVRESQFRFESFETVPITRLRRVSNRFTRELFTSYVRCRLRPHYLMSIFMAGCLIRSFVNVAVDHWV